MKIKNIMFSGFAAAIFAGVCASAQAASVNLASKKYVDTELALKQGILTPGDNINILDNVISATGLVTTEKLTEVQNALQDAIDAKQAAGEYADKEELETLKTTVETLKSGSADKETIETLKTTVETIAADYATKSELTEVEQRLQGAIDAIVVPTIPTLVSAFENDAGYITNDALTDLATKAEVNAKQAKLTAGDNITIDETTNVISATGFATQDALTNLQTTLEAAIEDKQAKGDYLTAESLTDLNNAVNALQSGKADATTVTALQNAINGLGETYATKEAMSAADEALQNAIDAINIPSLEGYVKSDDLATVATTGSYNDLTDTPTIPSLDGLATSEELDTLRTTLEAAIADKQEKGDYLTAESLTELNNAVTALQSGKADAATVTALQNAINGLGDTYATDAELGSAIDGVKALIPSLADYAKTADVEAELALKEDVANKVSGATAEEISAMSSEEKATKYPSISVAQTIAAAAVTEVNKVAGDLSTLQTQVTTNTADITEIKGAGYQTADNVETIVEGYGYQTADQVSGAITTATADLASKSYVDTAIAGIDEYDDTALAGRVTANEGAIATNTAAIADNKSAIEALEGAGYQTADNVKTTVEGYGYQTAEQVSDAITTATSGLVKGEELGALAYKDTVATADIDAKAVTAEKIAGQVPADGETMFMSVSNTGDAEWVAVKIY